MCVLHANGILHRDLKLSNVLVTNQHYLGKLPENEKSSRYLESPVKCKLTDFQETRATYLETRTLVETRTFRVDHGTPAFMASETHLESIRPMSHEDLKQADIWGFGMILYCLINHDVDRPYIHCLTDAAGEKRITRIIKSFFMGKPFTAASPEV